MAKIKVFFKETKKNPKPHQPKRLGEEQSGFLLHVLPPRRLPARCGGRERTRRVDLGPANSGGVAFTPPGPRQEEQAGLPVFYKQGGFIFL